LRNGAAEDMQQLFPEGYVFLHALYGLGWCEVASRLNDKSDLYQEAHAEIQCAYDHVDSDAGKSIFSEYQILPRGAFYNGWSSYLLVKKLSIEQPAKRNPEEIARFETQCKSIAEALAAQPSPYLTSYPGAAWPADMVLCMASLSAHDKVFDAHYRMEIGAWLKKVKARLDPHGLIPHEVHPRSGAMVEQARGCSQSLMLCFLPDIDTEFCLEQYTRYRGLFLDHRFGLPGIREYPPGNFGLGDVDSGPVFLQIGSVASIVGIRSLRVNGDISEATMLRNSLEPFALPLSSGDEKKYFFGQMPMGDAFLAWAHAAGQAEDMVEESAWRIKFHSYSAAIILLSALGYWYSKKRARQKIFDVSKSINQ